MKGAASSADTVTSTTQSHLFTLGPSNLRLFCWLVVTVTGLLEASGHRFQVDIDGVSYLDVAENYLHGDWHAAVSAYWSPLYSWLLALPLSFLHSSLYWESTLLHLVNFAVLLASYAAFEFFLRELVRSPLLLSAKGETAVSLPEGAWRILGLAVFLFSSLSMANYDGSTPDLCVNVAVWAATGLLLRIQFARAGWGTYACFGLTLGAGYLAKAAMFPLAFIFLGVALFATPAPAKARPKLMSAFLAFALIAGPWVALLSRSKGRLTFGDSGKLAYLGAMNSAWKSGFKGVSSVQGPQVLHPLAKLATDPETLGFASPVSGTFPPWYDASYWGEGAEAHFHWSNQLAILHGSYDSYFDILVSEEGLLAGLLAFLVVQGTFRPYLASVARFWTLWLPPLAAIGMYSLVLVQARYIAAFLNLIWVSLFAALRLPSGRETRRWVLAVPVSILLVVSLPIARSMVSDVYRCFRPEPYEAWEVAEELHRMGVQSNHSVAIIGLPVDTFDWARLARIRIVAMIPPGAVDEYWSAPSDVQAHVDSLFLQTGAIAAISCAPPPKRNLAGWTELGSSLYYVTLLRDAPQSSSSHSSE
jgi:hypothetical protein